MSSKNGTKLECSTDGDVAYLYLPKHPGKGISGISAKQVFLNSLINNYKGPEIILDFNKDGEIIGMEFIFD
ncbi:MULTISPECIES: DUF2283 domain-containing protein [Snodgrassella]|jgi:Protein of unknown function (DUF2283).|uniref:DUF2283 domain-containing protein n=1 Tax=Snodgrassella TaxID=1193515 RepID=UPI0015818623|nr:MULTISPECIES: DUF2283 domain-containing protein [unclassified Snodgrassella]MBI0069023.1 DUF2283 domain-containing protein [Snodgrassella sp. M0110]MBI0078023.1 DUF2283 domain-containing protein [Snodgrassella sp. M0118]MBI0080322.1 DUF2283 domain-containing protein [Snodgrassella sp. M0112]NUF77518.1 DUF2283 domain-containing protein [Snodgrassella sp. ESL0323]